MVKRENIPPSIINGKFLVSLGEKLFCNWDLSQLQTVELSGESGYRFLPTSELIVFC